LHVEGYFSFSSKFLFLLIFYLIHLSFFFLFQIRGLQIDEAIKQMMFSTKRAAGIIKQVWKANKGYMYMSFVEPHDYISTAIQAKTCGQTEVFNKEQNE